MTTYNTHFIVHIFPLVPFSKYNRRYKIIWFFFFIMLLLDVSTSKTRFFLIEYVYKYLFFINTTFRVSKHN